jgi:type VI secretion system protein ImpL
MTPRSPDRADARTLVTIAGLAAAAVLAGFAAPWLEFGGRSPLATDSARMLAVALLLCAAGAILLAQRALAARRNRALLARLAQGDTGEREVAFLGRRFEQTLAQLRRLRASRLLRPRLFVHELPWYLVIGAPGSGKTTALANSGLHFPLAEGREPQAVRGIGGTRNCDWWFASQAVLIDTAGRYTTQDSDRDADRTAWFGFLDLLRRHRPRRPLNGVLLTVSASDLLDPVPARLATHAQELRARLDELRQRLQATLPVYLLVTKTDLLPGFAECFADFDDGQRTQVWGATLPLQAAPARLAGELAALDARLQTHLQDCLDGEDDPARRAALAAFAAQWRLLARSALGLLQAVFDGDGDNDARDAARPLLRGLYFTSATQAAQAPAGSRRSFFVTRLLRDLVFAESGLAGRSTRALTLRRLLERGLLGASAIALALALAALLQAYRSQSQALDAVAARLPALDAAVLAAQRDDGPSALLAALDALATVQAAPANAQLAERLLDRREMLAGAAEDSSRRLLRGALLSRIAARLEARLQRSEGEPVARTYETLRAYLMLFGGKHFDPAALRAYLADDWQQTLPPHVGAAERAALLRHLDQLLATGEVGAPSRADAVLVAAARARVQGVSLAQRAATRLRQQASTLAAALPSANGLLVRADGSALADAAIPSATPLPPRERTRRLLAELAQEQAWVLGTPQAVAPAPALVDEVERLLVLDAAQAWQLLLDDLRLAAPRTLAASAQLARELARPDGPAVALLRAGARASPWLAALRTHVDTPTPQAAPMARTQALLARLAAQLDAADAAARRGALPPAPDALAELAQASHDAPAPWSRWLAQLHAAATGQLQAALREPLAQEASRHLAAWCASSASQRYPLVRDAQQELSRDEFVRAFGAGGSFDALQQRLIAPYGEAARGEALAPIRRALAVREAFFRDGGRALGTRLEFRLLGLDAGASEFTLEVDSQVLRFRRETRQAQGLEWLTLGGTGAGGGRVRVHLAPSANSAGYVFEGPWALLRLLDRARVERGDTPDRVLLVFDIEGRRARFEVRSSGAQHPLLRQDLELLSCPNRP